MLPGPPMTGRAIAVAAFVSALAVAACTPIPTTDLRPDVTGTWTLQGVFFAPGDSAGASATDTLELTGMVMTLRQSGTAFSGSYSGAVISVFNNRPFGYVGPASAPLSGSIRSGTATGVTVVFSAGLTNQPFKGVLTDSAMQGGATIFYTGSNGTEKFTGGWTAVRN